MSLQSWYQRGPTMNVLLRVDFERRHFLPGCGYWEDSPLVQCMSLGYHSTNHIKILSCSNILWNRSSHPDKHLWSKRREIKDQQFRRQLNCGFRSIKGATSVTTPRDYMLLHELRTFYCAVILWGYSRQQFSEETCRPSSSLWAILCNLVFCSITLANRMWFSVVYLTNKEA